MLSVFSMDSRNFHGLNGTYVNLPSKITIVSRPKYRDGTDKRIQYQSLIQVEDTVEIWDEKSAKRCEEYREAEVRSESRGEELQKFQSFIRCPSLCSPDCICSLCCVGTNLQ